MAEYERKYLFTFNDGRPKNPYWIYKTLENADRKIAKRIARGGGVLGWNQQSLNAAHISKAVIDRFVKLGIIEANTLSEIARHVIEEGEFNEYYRRLDRDGGFLAANAEDKKFYSDFDLARKIATEDPLDISEIRYHIKETGLFVLLNVWDG
jgi:hypothetical protein